MGAFLDHVPFGRHTRVLFPVIICPDLHQQIASCNSLDKKKLPVFQPKITTMTY